MKIERISESKIKLTVTGQDMTEWGVSIEHIIADTPKARELFRVLIKKAELEAGFYAENARLMIEALPGEYDGIDLFVTNLDIQESKNKKARLRAKAIEPKSQYGIFCFEKFDDLCDFVRNCSHANGEGALYKMDEKYYFVAGKDINPLIVEYGREEVEITFAHLKEHSKCVIERSAIETIEKYFK